MRDENEDELEAVAPRWGRRAGDWMARAWPYALATLAIVGLVYLFRAPLGTRYAARQLESAQTPEAEARALCRINDWSRKGHAQGYSLHAFDAEGEEIQPHIDGNYDAIATLVLTWSDGSKTERRLLGHDGLSCAYHG